MRTNSIKYLSIYEDLKEEIINGTYPIGGLFPAEPELQTLFGVSRITVRHAVQLLVDEGYLQRIHGVGTVVVSQKESLQLQNLLSFSEEYKGAAVHLSLTRNELIRPNVSLYQLFKEKGYSVKNANETIESVIADKKIADYLHVKEGSPLLFVQRVTKDQRDRIVEYAEFYYRGDRYRYSVQLHVPD